MISSIPNPQASRLPAGNSAAQRAPTTLALSGSAGGDAMTTVTLGVRQNKNLPDLGSFAGKTDVKGGKFRAQEFRDSLKQAPDGTWRSVAEGSGAGVASGALVLGAISWWNPLGLIALATASIVGSMGVGAGVGVGIGSTRQSGRTVAHNDRRFLEVAQKLSSSIREDTELWLCNQIMEDLRLLEGSFTDYGHIELYEQTAHAIAMGQKRAGERITAHLKNVISASATLPLLRKANTLFRKHSQQYQSAHLTEEYTGLACLLTSMRHTYAAAEISKIRSATATARRQEDLCQVEADFRSLETDFVDMGVGHIFKQGVSLIEEERRSLAQILADHRIKQVHAIEKAQVKREFIRLVFLSKPEFIKAGCLDIYESMTETAEQHYFAVIEEQIKRVKVIADRRAARKALE